MEELNEWKEQISHDEYDKLLEFINMTKNKQKIHNKFLFLHGNIQKAVKLAIDIENVIDVDDCEYMQFGEMGANSSIEYLDDFIKSENIKCLIIEDNAIHDGKSHSVYKCIKSFVGGDKINLYDKINNKPYQYFPNFNTIYLSPILPKDSSLLMRSIIINLK